MSREDAKRRRKKQKKQNKTKNAKIDSAKYLKKGALSEKKKKKKKKQQKKKVLKYTPSLIGTTARQTFVRGTTGSATGPND